MKFGFIFSFLFLSLSTWSQSTNPLHFKSLEEILSGSESITKETFDLKFLLRALPDNAWFLKLNKDSTFEYIHWSGWSETGITVLEKGSYSITDNLIQLKSDKSLSELASRSFYILTSDTKEIDNNITIDCVESDSKIYCLYKN